jgi:hypothetical protein
MNATVRFAEPKDAESFAKWAAENPDVPQRDIDSTGKNPTTTTLVVEIDGVPVLYVPFYCLMNICYLGFNPDSDRKQRLRAMSAMLDGLQTFAKQFGIAEIQTLSLENYPVAQWALKHGFTIDNRNPLTFEVPNV